MGPICFSSRIVSVEVKVNEASDVKLQLKVDENVIYIDVRRGLLNIQTL